MSPTTRGEDVPPQLPSQEENPVERRRLLNIQAQRRYRKRKQARLQELEAGLAAKDVSTQSKSALQHIENHLLDIAGMQPAYDQSTLFFDDLDDVFTVSQVFNAGEDVSMGLNPLPDAAIEPISNTDVSLSSPSNMLSSIVDDTPSMPTYLQAVSNPATDFADYAITTPGLSVMRAHVTIVQHLHGPDFPIDIWNPCTLSPFCIEPRDTTISHIPLDFQPTPLQKRIQHHPVVDCLPWKSFRDRFLYVMNLPMNMRPKIAQQDMPSVTLELMFALKDAGGGLRVWDLDPFVADNWEIGQTFYSKFWWAIDGDIIKHSNNIRSKRGELPLRFDVTHTQ